MQRKFAPKTLTLVDDHFPRSHLPQGVLGLAEEDHPQSRRPRRGCEVEPAVADDVLIGVHHRRRDCGDGEVTSEVGIVEVTVGGLAATPVGFPETDSRLVSISKYPIHKVNFRKVSKGSLSTG